MRSGQQIVQGPLFGAKQCDKKSQSKEETRNGVSKGPNKGMGQGWRISISSGHSNSEDHLGRGLSAVGMEKCEIPDIDKKQAIHKCCSQDRKVDAVREVDGRDPGEENGLKKTSDQGDVYCVCDCPPEKARRFKRLIGGRQGLFPFPDGIDGAIGFIHMRGIYDFHYLPHIGESPRRSSRRSPPVAVDGRGKPA